MIQANAMMQKLAEAKSNLRAAELALEEAEKALIHQFAKHAIGDDISGYRSNSGVSCKMKIDDIAILSSPDNKPRFTIWYNGKALTKAGSVTNIGAYNGHSVTVNPDNTFEYRDIK